MAVAVVKRSRTQSNWNRRPNIVFAINIFFKQTAAPIRASVPGTNERGRTTFGKPFTLVMHRFGMKSSTDGRSVLLWKGRASTDHYYASDSPVSELVGSLADVAVMSNFNFLLFIPATKTSDGELKRPTLSENSCCNPHVGRNKTIRYVVCEGARARQDDRGAFATERVASMCTKRFRSESPTCNENARARNGFYFFTPDSILFTYVISSKRPPITEIPLTYFSMRDTEGYGHTERITR